MIVSDNLFICYFNWAGKLRLCAPLHKTEKNVTPKGGAAGDHQGISAGLQSSGWWRDQPWLPFPAQGAFALQKVQYIRTVVIRKLSLSSYVHREKAETILWWMFFLVGHVGFPKAPQTTKKPSQHGSCPRGLLVPVSGRPIGILDQLRGFMGGGWRWLTYNHGTVHVLWTICLIPRVRSRSRYQSF